MAIQTVQSPFVYMRADRKLHNIFKSFSKETGRTLESILYEAMDYYVDEIEAYRMAKAARRAEREAIRKRKTAK